LQRFEQNGPVGSAKYSLGLPQIAQGISQVGFMAQ
jgi:hypothetical protein